MFTYNFPFEYYENSNLASYKCDKNPYNFYGQKNGVCVGSSGDYTYSSKASFPNMTYYSTANCTGSGGGFPARVDICAFEDKDGSSNVGILMNSNMNIPCKYSVLSGLEPTELTMIPVLRSVPFEIVRAPTKAPSMAPTRKPVSFAATTGWLLVQQFADNACTASKSYTAIGALVNVCMPGSPGYFGFESSFKVSVANSKFSLLSAERSLT